MVEVKKLFIFTDKEGNKRQIALETPVAAIPDFETELNIFNTTVIQPIVEGKIKEIRRFYFIGLLLVMNNQIVIGFPTQYPIVDRDDMFHLIIDGKLYFEGIHFDLMVTDLPNTSPYKKSQVIKWGGSGVPLFPLQNDMTVVIEYYYSESNIKA